jgi:hypothetical protein
MVQIHRSPSGAVLGCAGSSPGYEVMNGFKLGNLLYLNELQQNFTPQTEFD